MSIVPPDQARPQTRSSLVDALRGIAICAVVLGHANTGVVSAGLAQEHRSAFVNLNITLYLIHMPLFAFLMGLTMKNAWQRHPHPQYMVQRIKLFGWLFLVWTVIQGSFEVAASRFQNGEGTTVWDVVNLWVPIAHLWFLPWAILVMLVIFGTQPWKKRFLSWFVLTASIVGGIALWGNTGTDIAHNGMAIVHMTVLGAVIGLDRFNTWAEKWSVSKYLLMFATWVIYLVIVVGGVPNTRPTSADISRTPLSITWGIIATYAGCVAVILTVSCLNRLWAMRWATYLGKLSLQIFLAHLLFTPASRVVLTKLGIVSPILVDVIATGVGILGAVALYYMARRWFPWIFTLPRSASSGSNHSPAPARHLER